MATLILGASGLLGRALLRGFVTDGAIGTCHTRLAPGLIPLDIRHTAAVDELLAATGADVVINAIGERRPEMWARRPNAMHALNTQAAATIAQAVTAAGAWLLHISSDYVFPGGQPPYTPDDPTRPVNSYGHSKLAAEHHVRALAPTAVILRIPVLFGPAESPGESNITTLAAAVASGRPIRVDHTVRRYPTHVDDVTAVCRDLAALTHTARPAHGVWHYSSTIGRSKYDLARLIAAVHDLPADHLTPDDTPLHDRPGDCRLDCTALTNLLGSVPEPRQETFANRVRAVTHTWIQRARL